MCIRDSTKHDPGFPAHAVRFCLDFAGLKPVDLDYVAFYDKPFLKFERLLETYPVSYTHLRAHETVLDLVCRLLLEKKNAINLPSIHIFV